MIENELDYTCFNYTCDNSGAEISRISTITAKLLRQLMNKLWPQNPVPHHRYTESTGKCPGATFFNRARVECTASKYFTESVGRAGESLTLGCALISELRVPVPLVACCTEAPPSCGQSKFTSRWRETDYFHKKLFDWALNLQRLSEVQ